MTSAPEGTERPEPASDDVPLTFVDGPSDPIRLADQPGTWAEVDVGAPPERVWALVTDIDLPARFSTEFLGASWIDGDGPALGASFLGRNEHHAIGTWEVPAFVDVYDERRSFGWATLDAANPGSRWRFDVEPLDAGHATRLRYSVSLGPGPSGISIAIEAMPGKEPRILVRRIREHHANMVRTLEGIAAVAEGRA